MGGRLSPGSRSLRNCLKSNNVHGLASGCRPKTKTRAQAALLRGTNCMQVQFGDVCRNTSNAPGSLRLVQGWSRLEIACIFDRLIGFRSAAQVSRGQTGPHSRTTGHDKTQKNVKSKKKSFTISTKSAQATENSVHQAWCRFET